MLITPSSSTRVRAAVALVAAVLVPASSSAAPAPLPSHPRHGVLLQDPPPAPDTVVHLAEIVVTARNRAEPVQDIPLAISAYAGRQLELRQIGTTEQLGYITPNLTFNSSGAFAGATFAAQVFIRGAGQTDYLPVTDPGVAVYVDGIYMARSIGAVMELLDIERAEVLRGPQGTLFGRNAMGGAVSLHSRRPGDEPRRSLRMEIGNDRMTNLTAMTSGRLGDRLSAGATVSHRRRNGYVERVHDGLDMGDDNAQAARGSLVWRPRDGLEVFTTADYTRRRENGAPTVSGGVNDRMAFGTFGNALLPGCAAVRINPGFPASGPPSFPPPGSGTGRTEGCYGPATVAGAYLAEGTFPAFADLDSWGGSAELTWSLGEWATLRSLTGYRGMRMETSRDADNTPANILSTQDLLDHAQLSEELQLGGPGGDGRVHWQTGLYLFREYGYQRTDVIVPPGALGSGADYDNGSVAGFAQVTGEVVGRLALTLGGRYTIDQKGLRPDLYARGDASQGAGSIFDPSWPRLAGIYLSPTGSMRPGDRMIPREDFGETFRALTLTAKLSYDFTSRVMGYGGYSEGFKSGGYDVRYPAPPEGHPPNSATAAPGVFRPETVSSYEMGLKSLLADGRVRVNLALFRADYEDLQILVRESFNPITFNGGSADISGLEVEAAWADGSGWDIRAGLGAMRASYESLSPGVLDNATPVLPGHRLAKTPGLNHSVTVARSFRSAHGTEVTPRASWFFTGSQYHDAINTPQLFQDGYHLLDASVGLQTRDGDWELVLAARNLTNERYLVTGNSAFATSAAYVELVYGRPLEWSVSVERSW